MLSNTFHEAGHVFSNADNSTLRHSSVSSVFISITAYVRRTIWAQFDWMSSFNSATGYSEFTL